MQKNMYHYLKHQDMWSVLYFINESSRMKEYAEGSVNKADSGQDLREEVSVNRKFLKQMRTGLIQTGFDWYYYRNDEVDWDYTGLAKNQFGWYYVRNGVLDQSYYGIVRNRYGAWCVEKGTINHKANGYRRVGRQEAFFTDGKVDSDVTGFIYSNGEWRVYDKGMVDMQYKGLVKNEHGWWYVEGGEINYVFEGLVENEYGWWYIKHGTIDYSFKGYARNQDGWHYVESGTVRDNEPRPVVRDKEPEVTAEGLSTEKSSVEILDIENQNKETIIERKKELAGTELAEYAVSKYASGELGLRTIFSSLGAWIKYKL